MTPSPAPMPRLQQKVNELENLVDRLEHDLDTAQKRIEELEQDNKLLREQIRVSDVAFQYQFERNESLEKQLLAMRVFLNGLRIGHDLDVPEEVWSELFAPSDLSRKYVKREIAEQLVHVLELLLPPIDNMNFPGSTETRKAKEALTLARKELEK